MFTSLKEPVLAALPRPGAGTLHDRLVCTAVDGRLAAKTGSLSEVNTLAGYLDLGGGKGYVFDIMANNHTARSAQALAQIDSLVLALTDRRLKPLGERPACPPPK